MPERNRPEINPLHHLSKEVENRNATREKGDKKVTETDVMLEELSYSNKEQEHAINRTYEVAERIETAKKIDAQRSRLARIGIKLGVIKGTTEKDVAFEEATKENEEIDAKEARRTAEKEELQRDAEKRASERKTEEKLRLRTRNAEINTRLVEINKEIHEQEKKMAETIKSGRDRRSGGTSVVYSINPDGTPNNDPDRRPQNSTGFVEHYRTKIAELQSEEVALKKEHATNLEIISAE